MTTTVSTGQRTRALTLVVARVLFPWTPPAALALVGLSASRGGPWLVLLAPAGAALAVHARVLARTGLRVWGGALGTGALAGACVALLALGAGPALGLYRTVTVLSGSMRPTFAPGDMIVVTPEPARDLKVGQVISYRIPVDGRPIETHRVVRILESGDEPIVQTKGDANNADDPWQAKLHGGTLWRFRFRVPLVGYPILALRTPFAHWLLVVLAPVLLALYLLSTIWRPRPRRPAAPRARTDP